jgi:hypothetical protein
MRYAYLSFVVAAVFAFLPGRGAWGQTSSGSEAVQVQLEVDALSTLDDLNLTSDQLAALKDLAKDTAGTLSGTPGPITAEYLDALKELKSALLGKDDDKIDSAGDKAGDLGEKQDDDAIPDVTQSPAAKSKAADALKMLTVKQVADYIGDNSDAIDDPAELLIQAIHDCRGLAEPDFVGLRDDTSEELGVFAAGPNLGKPPAIVVKTNALLNRAHKMSDAEYSAQQSALEDEARKLVSGMEAIPNLRHWMENEMADLLANPQLIQAIDDWKGAGKV